MLHKTDKNHNGFTLVEIVAVIALIGIITVLSFMVYSRVHSSFYSWKQSNLLNARVSNTITQLQNDFSFIEKSELMQNDLKLTVNSDVTHYVYMDSTLQRNSRLLTSEDVEISDLSVIFHENNKTFNFCLTDSSDMELLTLDNIEFTEFSIIAKTKNDTVSYSGAVRNKYK